MMRSSSATNSLSPDTDRMGAGGRPPSWVTPPPSCTVRTPRNAHNHASDGIRGAEDQLATCTSWTAEVAATNTCRCLICSPPDCLRSAACALLNRFRGRPSKAPGVAWCNPYSLLIPCAALTKSVQAQLTPKPPLLILPVPSAAMLLTLLLAANTAALPSGLMLDACLLSWPAALLALLFWRVVGLDTAAGGGMLVTSSMCSP